MKKLFAFFFISIFFCSCQKDKQVSIVGLWTEISYCIKDNSGAFDCSGAQRFPLSLTLSEDGEYSFFNDVPAGHGIYQYNYSNRKLIFESSGGNVEIRMVSLLDDDYLIIDYSSNGVIDYSQKFLRR